MPGRISIPSRYLSKMGSYPCPAPVDHLRSRLKIRKGWKKNETKTSVLSDLCNKIQDASVLLCPRGRHWQRGRQSDARTDIVQDEKKKKKSWFEHGASTPEIECSAGGRVLEANEPLTYLKIDESCPVPAPNTRCIC